jgi:hypothetical protein
MLCHVFCTFVCHLYDMAENCSLIVTFHCDPTMTLTTDFKVKLFDVYLITWVNIIWFQNCCAWTLLIWISWIGSDLGKIVIPMLVSFMGDSDLLIFGKVCINHTFIEPQEQKLRHQTIGIWNIKICQTVPMSKFEPFHFSPNFNMFKCIFVVTWSLSY